jgi:hypothetical protein
MTVVREDDGKARFHWRMDAERRRRRAWSGRCACCRELVSSGFSIASQGVRSFRVVVMSATLNATVPASSSISALKGRSARSCVD